MFKQKRDSRVTLHRKHRIGFWAVFLILLLCFGGMTGCSPREFSQVTAQASGQSQESREEPISSDQEESSGNLILHYLDVGQGNAVLAESEGHYMLIDGGERKTSSFVVSYLEKQGVKELDYLLISHFDEDHLAGAIGAMHKYPVAQLITPDYETDSSIYRSYREAAQEKGYEEIHPAVGDLFQLGSASFRVISPAAYGHEDENQDSVGILLQNGQHKFFLGGDIGLQSEKEILEAGTDIQADVMLMNHHGSHVSKDFFQEVNPEFAVISCGKGNSYGHPRQDTVDLLSDAGTALFRTDIQGTIVAESVGGELSFSQEACNDYTPGQRQGNLQEEAEESMNNAGPEDCTYILNAHTKKIHLPTCPSVNSMDEDNKAYFKGEKQELLDNGYTPCGNCKP